MISEGSVNVTTFFVFTTLFGVIAEDQLIIKGGCPLWDVCFATGVGQANGLVSGDKVILRHCQDEPEVEVLAPAAGYSWLTPHSRWGQEAVGNGVERLGVRHIWFLSLVTNR